ncbi:MULTISPECIES: TrbG/VirB9 family P-type conjugative transfer protein [Sphingomonas]|uniref:TrbG/VirB9 family P-type conjugative transfer protein n=1 Tax=Sphingomonas TaxID=13687 RepID=UPI000DEEF049|nr:MULTISPECIES: TrbG/VirB9 family P-type conjugative transfer protein [Sphingomonas]
MTRSILLLACLPLVLAAQPASADNRVRSVLYAPNHVFGFVGKPGFQSSIRFGDDERIENIAVGDSAAWQVTPNKRGNYLFIKPMVTGAHSNLMVITDQRTYLFDLNAPRGAQPVYALSFDYPAYPAPGSIQPPPVPAPAAPVRQATLTLLPKAAPERLDFAWNSSGAKSLRPGRVFSDPVAVYMSWPENLALPAVLVPAPDGTESPVSYKVDGGYIVVAGLPPQIIIRRGRERALVSAARPRSPVPTQTASSESRP